MAIPLVKVFWPLTINSANNKIDYRHFADGADRTATVASATYYSATLFAAAVKAALDTASAGAGITWTITISSMGVMTFTTSGGTSFTLKFGTGANAGVSPRYLLGFFAADYASTGLNRVAPAQHQNGWYAPLGIRNDSKDYFEEPNSVITVTMAGQTKSIAEPVLTMRDVKWQHLSKEYTLIAEENLSTPNTAMERWWRDGRGRFRYWPDASVEGTSADYVLDISVLSNGFKPARMYDGKELYSVGPWKMRKYV
jgi:hypothetical protein